MSRRFDLVIFDCDGVLLDSEILAVEAEVSAFTRYGVPVDAAYIVEHCMGLSWKSELALISERFNVELPAEISDYVREETARLFDSRLEAVAGIHEALDRLEMPVCVASSSSPERLRHGLGLVGLYDRFAPNIFSSTMVSRGKPAPDLFLFAAGKMGVAPGRCVVIEDSRHGVAAGRAAGMTVIGFIGGSHCPPDAAKRLREAGAERVISSHADLGAAIAETADVAAGG